MKHVILIDFDGLLKVYEYTSIGEEVLPSTIEDFLAYTINHEDPNTPSEQLIEKALKNFNIKYNEVNCYRMIL